MDVVDVLAKNSHVTSEVPPIVPEVEVTPGPSGVSLLAAVENMDGVENVPVVQNVTIAEDNNNINENITVENSSIENITKINVVKDKDNVGISDFSSQESRGMECSDSPDISSFSSSTKASDLSSRFGVVFPRLHAFLFFAPFCLCCAPGMTRRGITFNMSFLSGISPFVFAVCMSQIVILPRTC